MTGDIAYILFSLAAVAVAYIIERKEREYN